MAKIHVLKRQPEMGTPSVEVALNALWHQYLYQIESLHGLQITISWKDRLDTNSISDKTKLY